MEWRRLRSVLLRLNNRGYGAGRPRNLVSPNMLCRRLLRLDLSAAGPCLEDVNRVEGSEPPQEPWSWEKTDDMLETGNLTAGISTLDLSISLLGNYSAQPYCVAGTSLLRQFLLAAGVPSMSAPPLRFQRRAGRVTVHVGGRNPRLPF